MKNLSEDVLKHCPSVCVMCQQPIPAWRYGSDYCSPRCWEKHHGAELDHVDNYYDCDGKEPEDLE